MTTRRQRGNDTVKKPPRCTECGQPKPPGQGRRYCDECLDKQHGTPRGAARHQRFGEQLCEPCIEAERQYRSTLNKTRRRQNGYINRADQAPEGTRWCPRCEQYLLIEAFRTRTHTSGNVLPKSYCRECELAYTREYNFREKFGITPAEYDALLAAQNGRCAICQNKPRKRALAIDHNHKTKVIRGLLCTRCNHHLLGSAHESVEMLQRAINYLKNPPALQAFAINTPADVKRFLETTGLDTKQLFP
jgi:Recombination endonuclease VII